MSLTPEALSIGVLAVRNRTPLRGAWLSQLTAGHMVRTAHERGCATLTLAVVVGPVTRSRTSPGRYWCLLRLIDHAAAPAFEVQRIRLHRRTRDHRRHAGEHD